MVVQGREWETKFVNMPNFRPLDSIDDHDSATEITTKLYRSSRPDFLSDEEIGQFKELGVKAIIDFRSPKEYRDAPGDKRLDAVYSVFKVRTPFRLRYKPNEQVQFKALKSVGKDEAENRTTDCGDTNGKANLANRYGVNEISRRHFLVDFFKIHYVLAIFTRAPWYKQLFSLLFLIFDVLFNTGYIYFIRYFARNVLNNEGLLGQYKNMITYSQPAISAALKLLTDPENVPAMLNCAHGKDRTGIVTSLVLACLGKSKEFIAQDYARSETDLAPMKGRVYDEIVTKFHMSETFITAKAETMLQLLDYIEEEYGSISGYLEYIGFSPSEQEKLRKNLLN